MDFDVLTDGSELEVGEQANTRGHLDTVFIEGKRSRPKALS